MNKLPFRIYIYFLGQSINLTTAVMSVTMAALVGASIAPSPWMSTVPYGFQFLCVTLLTYPVSKLMIAIGRKKSFLIATIPLALSGVVGFIAVENHSFILLMLSHSLLGAYIAFANFNRFAATDNIPTILKPKAISLVVAGGILASIIGPFLTINLKDFDGLNAFSACYAAFVGLAAISFVLNLIVKSPENSGEHAEDNSSHTKISTILNSRVVLLAISVGAVGYGLMNLIMIQASMYLATLDVHFDHITAAIQWHVVAMFAPSFFTGLIIQRLGLKSVVMYGIYIILLCALINIFTNNYYLITFSLILLGLGWNFTYVGGSALLALSMEGSPFAKQAQGINDVGISIFATIGSFTPALFLALIGWQGTNILSILICAALAYFAVLVFKGKAA